MRILDNGEIVSATKGVSRADETADGLSLLRFPSKIAGHFSAHEAYSIRIASPAGVVLDFFSDATRVEITCTFPSAAARPYAYCDVYADDVFAGYVGGANVEPGDLTGAVTFPDRRNRRIRIYLPHTRPVAIGRITLSDGAAFAPVARRPTWIAYGDSITQGMNARHPSLTYPALAARSLDLDIHNAAVGGARFDEGFLLDEIAPGPVAFVTVAYGTNDFSAGIGPEKSRAFLLRLIATYPAIPVIALEPIWRTDDDPALRVPRRDNARLCDYRNRLREIVAEFPGVKYVPAGELMPAGVDLIRDGTHPDTDGHVVMGQNLAARLKKFAAS